MQTPPLGVFSGGVSSVSASQFRGVAKASPQPLRFLENRDLFFSSSSVRASIDPFLNNAQQKTLYLLFTPEPGVGLIRKLWMPPHAAIVLNKQADMDKANTGKTSQLVVSALHYKAADTVEGNLFTPGLPMFFELDQPANWFQQLLGKQRHVETLIRLPHTQTGIVLQREGDKTYNLQSNHKNTRTQIRDDVLAVIGELEKQGYQLSEHYSEIQPVAKNPFILTPQPENVLQPV